MFPTIARKIKTATALLIIPSLTSWKAPHAAIKIVDGRLIANPMIWIHFLFMFFLQIEVVPNITKLSHFLAGNRVFFCMAIKMPTSAFIELNGGVIF